MWLTRTFTFVLPARSFSLVLQLDQHLPELCNQAHLHHRQGTTDHPMGT